MPNFTPWFNHSRNTHGTSVLLSLVGHTVLVTGTAIESAVGKLLSVTFNHNSEIFITVGTRVNSTDDYDGLISDLGFVDFIPEESDSNVLVYCIDSTNTVTIRRMTPEGNVTA